MVLARWIRELQNQQKYRVILRWIILASLLINIPRIAYRHFLYTRPDTRKMTASWVQENLSPGSALCYDHYHYDIDLIDLDRFFSYGAGSRFLDQEIKQRLQESGQYSNNYRFISPQKDLEVSQLSDSLLSRIGADTFLIQSFTHPHKSFTELRSEGAQILILNSYTYLKFLSNPPPPETNPLRSDFLMRQQFYEQVLNYQQPVAIFKPSWKNPGPVIQIFDLRGLSHDSGYRNQRLQL